MPLVLLAIYIGLIFLRPMDWWGPVKYLPLVNVAAILTILMSFPILMRDHVFLFRRVPQVRLIMALLVGLSCSWLPVFYLGGMSGTFQVFGKIVVLYLLIIFLADDERGVRFLVWVVLLCVFWMAIHGILQIHTGKGFGGLEPRWRKDREVFQTVAFGIFNDPNDLCLAYVLAMPILYAEFRSTPNPMAKFMSLVMLPFMGYAAWLTNSRGGVVGIFGMLVAYTFARMKGMRRYFVAGFAIFLVTIFAPSRFAGGMAIDVARVNAWGEGLAAWKAGLRHMVFGIGWGTYRDITDDWIPAHNSYIEPLTEGGLLSYIPYMSLIVLTLLHAWRLMPYKNVLSRHHRLLLAGLGGGLVGYLTAAYFLSRSYNHVLYVLLGLLLAEVICVCRTYNLWPVVFGNLKRDLRIGVLTAAATIPLIWISIRIANLGR